MSNLSSIRRKLSKGVGVGPPPPPPNGVIVRLECIEQQLSLVQGFVQKLFGNNFEEYCREKVGGGGNSCGGKSSEDGECWSVLNNTTIRSSKRTNHHQDSQSNRNGMRRQENGGVVNTCNDDMNDHDNVNDKKQELRECDDRFNAAVTDSDDHITKVHQCLDPLVNPFLEVGDQDDPIGEERPEEVSEETAVTSFSSVAFKIEGNDNDCGERASDGVDGGVAEGICQDEEYISRVEVSNGMEMVEENQDPDRLSFFDDGVDQQQFSGYFEEEDAEPFSVFEEERDVKVLTILDMQDSKSSGSSGGLFGSGINSSIDTKPIRIKVEHGQVQDMYPNPMSSHQRQDDDPSDGRGKCRPKRRAASYTAPSTSVSKPGRKRKLISDDNSNDDDSDFKLESDEDVNSCSSSSSESDGGPNSMKQQQQSIKTLKCGPVPFPGMRRGRGPGRPRRINYSFPHRQVEIAPKPPNMGRPNFNPNMMTISPILNPVPNWSVPVNKVVNPVPEMLPLRRFRNPIEILPKVINGVYFRLVSISVDKQTNKAVVTAKCAMCAASAAKDFIVNGYGKSNANFIEHFQTSHPIQFFHYKANEQKIDAATMRLRRVISKHTTAGPNPEAVFISQYLRKITSLNPETSQILLPDFKSK